MVNTGEFQLMGSGNGGQEVIGVDEKGNATHNTFQVGKIGRTLIALDGQTLRVLDCAELERPIGTFGEPGMQVKAAITIGSGTSVIVRYVDRQNKAMNYVECWNYKTQTSAWEVSFPGLVTHMAPVFDKTRGNNQYADAVVIATSSGMKTGLAVLGANGKFRSNPVELTGKISQLVSDRDGGGNAALAITDEGVVAWIGSDGSMRGEPVSIEGLISTLALSEDGTQAVAGTQEGYVWWIDSEYGESEENKPIKLRGSISHLLISADGTSCLVGTMHGVVAWVGQDCILGESELHGMQTYVTALIMSDDGTIAVAGTNIGSVEWIGSDGVIVGSVAELSGEITHLKLTEDNSRVLVAAGGGVVAWINNDGTIIGRFEVGKEISCMELSSDDAKSNMGLVGLVTGEVVWIGVDGKPVGDCPNLFGKINQLTMKANGKGALAVTDEGTIAWISKEGKIEGGVAETDELLSAMAMNDSRDTVLVAATKYDDDGYRSTVMWLTKLVAGLSTEGAKAMAAAELRGESCRMRGDYVRIRGEVTKLAVTTDGTSGVCGTEEGLVIWITADGGEPGASYDLQAKIIQIDLNRDGSKALVGAASGTIAWVTVGGDVQGEIQQLESEITAVATFKGGNGIGVVGTEAGEVVRFDDSGNEPQWQKQLDYGGITTLDALPNGNILAGTTQGAVVWCNSDGEVLRDIRVPVRKDTGGICAVKLNADATSALVATKNGVVVRVPYDESQQMEILSGVTDSPVTLLPYGNQDEYLAFDIGASRCLFVGVSTGNALLGAASAEVEKLGAAGKLAAQSISEIGIHLDSVPNGATYKFNSRHYLMGQWSEQHPTALIGDQLIFGRSLDRMWGVDVSMMMVHGIEVVNTIGPGRAYLSSIMQSIEFYASRVNFAQTSALLFITQWQFISMAFHPSISWLLPLWATSVIRFPATLGLDSEWVPPEVKECVTSANGNCVQMCGNVTMPEVPWYVPTPKCLADENEDGSQALSDDEILERMLANDDTDWIFAYVGMVVTVIFMAVLTFQELVEANVFHRVPGPWPQVWQVLQSFTAALTGPLFMPMVGILLDPLSNTDGTVINQFRMYPVSAGLCVVFSVIYITLALRMVRVGQDMSAIEFKWYRPFQSSMDIASKKASTNPLEELEERWLPTFQQSLADRDANLKLFNIAIPSLFPHNTKVIALSIFITGLWLSVDAFFTVDRSSGLRFSGPYPDKKTNQGVFLLKLLTFITGLWALAIGFLSLDGDATDSQVFQSVYFVIAIGLLGVSGLYLTPLMTIVLQRTQPPPVDPRELMNEIMNPTFEVEDNDKQLPTTATEPRGNIDAADNSGVEWKDDY